MSWRAQSRSEDAKTPSVAEVWSDKPEPDRCPVQPYTLVVLISCAVIILVALRCLITFYRTIRNRSATKKVRAGTGMPRPFARALPPAAARSRSLLPARCTAPRHERRTRGRPWKTPAGNDQLAPPRVTVLTTKRSPAEIARKKSRAGVECSPVGCRTAACSR
jgi:hypothetical protein